MPARRSLLVATPMPLIRRDERPRLQNHSRPACAHAPLPLVFHASAMPASRPGIGPGEFRLRRHADETRPAGAARRRALRALGLRLGA